MKGYTLIELLIVIAIMAILFTVGFTSFQSYSRQQALISTTRAIQTDIRTVKENAIAGTKPAGCTTLLNGYKINITSSTTYEIDANCTPNTDIQVKTVTIPEGFTIGTPNPNPIFFKSLAQGTNIPTDTTASIVITQTSTSKTNTIVIGESGNVQ